ncbi:MAG: helix-turn-helix domain-containing protein [Verrucomicrobia bacterium]|nr:helix-turn-helix domain-containing protein [Verrucomicrobiota bacterium]
MKANADADTALLERLSRSELYNNFEQAFEASTGLPLRLRPLEFCHLAHRGRPHEHPFCALLSQTRPGCASYLEIEQRAVAAARDRPAMVTCFAGLRHTAVPVKLGQRTIGYLLTGQVALAMPSEPGFAPIDRQLSAWGFSLEQRQRLQDAFHQGRVLLEGQYTGAVHLLEIFAGQLASMANQIALHDSQAEPPLVRRAKAYIADHQTNPVGLGEVARAMHVDPYHFCKVFKKATGLTFTEYLGRVRVENAKALLANPHLRVSEIAYMVGFQSLTHFNRRFHQVTGQSPTGFRENGLGNPKSAAKSTIGGIPLRRMGRSAPERRHHEPGLVVPMAG